MISGPATQSDPKPDKQVDIFRLELARLVVTKRQFSVVSEVESRNWVYKARCGSGRGKILGC